MAQREVFKVDYPIRGTRSKVVLISGQGLPVKVGIGAVDLSDSTWLELQNRNLPSRGSRYYRVETVMGGLIRLHERPLQKSDQYWSARSGATVRHGALDGPSTDERGEIVEAESSDPPDTCAWIVTDNTGKYLLVAPSYLDSVDVADMIADCVYGEFSVELVSAGTMTVSEDIVGPGWKIIKQSGVRRTPSVGLN